VKNYCSPHTHVSSLDSGSTPEAFIKREVELDSGAICVTDHGHLAAIPETYKLAKENGLILVPGIEGYFRDDSDSVLKGLGIDPSEYNKFEKDELKYTHVTLHAQDAEAYEALVQEISKADFRAEQHGSERKPLFDWAQLERLGGYNITMGSGCLIGWCQRHLMVDRPDVAIAYYEKARSLVKPGNFFVELMPHRCTHNWVSGVFLTIEGGEKLKFWKGKKLKTTLGEFAAEDLARLSARGKPLGQLVAIKNYRVWTERPPVEILKCEMVEDFIPNECTPKTPEGDVQLTANRFMYDLAKKYGDKILVSGDDHLAYPEDKIVQDSRLLSQGGSWRMHSSYHRQSSAESYDYFKTAMGVPEAEFEGWVENSREWSSTFKDFKFNKRTELPTKFYPTNTLEHFKSLIDKHGRMQWGNPVWMERLQAEIQLLHFNGTTDFLPYMFIGEEVCYLYEQNRMLTGPGRGSAAGLLTAYLLGITHVDPIAYKLSMDRFMTKVRIESGARPDIDQDLPTRDILLHPETGFIYKRFGDHVAAISTETKLRLKSSIKDVARSKRGFVPPELEALCKKFPDPPQGVEDIDFIFGYVGDDQKEVKGLIEENKDLQGYIQEYPDEWKIVQKMLGITRGYSRHACAYVFCNEPVSNFIPLTTISGIRTTQYNAAGVEMVGGLKMDFLGLNSLQDIQSTIKLIQGRLGIPTEADYKLDGKRVPAFRLVPFNGRFYDVWDLPTDERLKGIAFDAVVEKMHGTIDAIDANRDLIRNEADLQAVFRDIAEGKTETVFQLSTNSARQWLKQFNYEKSEGTKAIDSIEAISAFTALDRPGPLDAEVAGRQRQSSQYACRIREPSERPGGGREYPSPRRFDSRDLWRLDLPRDPRGSLPGVKWLYGSRGGRV
jgi:DNA polymerase III alpha subunit